MKTVSMMDRRLYELLSQHDGLPRWTAVIRNDHTNAPADVLDELPRWTAVIWYRTVEGPAKVEHIFEELEELHDLVELGPSFLTIDRIEIRLSENPLPNETIESSLTR